MIVILPFFISRDNLLLLPNVVEQAIKDSNEYLVSKNKPPLSQEVVNLIEVQILSIKEDNHKIKMLVGNIVLNIIYCIIYITFI